MEIDELNRIRRLMGYTCADIAAHSGIPLGTVRKALEKKTLHPRKTTLEALARALREMILEDQRTGNIIHETVSTYCCGSGRTDPEARIRTEFQAVYQILISGLFGADQNNAAVLSSDFRNSGP